MRCGPGEARFRSEVVRKKEGRELRAQLPADCAQGESLDCLVESVAKGLEGFAASLSRRCKKFGRQMARAEKFERRFVVAPRNVTRGRGLRVVVILHLLCSKPSGLKA
jgi:hypothetical protein